MASTAHTTAQRTVMQAQYTALKAAVTAMNSAGNRTASAAHSADLQELQLVTTREQGAALT
jgi:hypothetical protein